MRNTIFFIMVLLLCSKWSISQIICKNELKIKVLETHDFTPLHPALVHIEELQQSFETDEYGQVFIKHICDGDYIVHIHASGYKDVEKKITVSGNTSARIKVDYEEHRLKEVTITDEHSRSILQTKAQLNADDLNNASGKSIGDLLQKITGVTTLGTGATILKPVIHGLHSNRIAIMNNDIRQEDQQWGSEHAPNIDPFTAGRVTVVKGAAGVRYGTDAIGGVVLIEPHPLSIKPGWEGALNLAAFSNNKMGVANAMIEHTSKKIPALSFRVQGSYKKGGNYRIPHYWVANTGIEENNYAATLAYRKLHYGATIFYSRFNTNIGIYKGSHTGSESDRLNAINSPFPLVQSDFGYEIERPKQHVTHSLIKAKLYADSKFGLWNLIYGYQHNFRQEYDIVRKETGRAQLNLHLQTHTIDLNLKHQPIWKINGQIGWNATYQDNRFEDGDRLFIPTYNSFGNGLYLIEKYRLNKINLEAGLRYDYRWYGVYNPEGAYQQIVYYEFDYQNISATLGLQHRINHHWEWSATLSQAWRAPQANELFSAGLHHGAARIELGNKNLGTERSYSFNLGTEYAVTENLNAKISYYSQLIHDYIYLEPGEDMLTIRGYFKTFHYRQTNAWLNGIDASLNYESDHLSSSFKAAFLRAKDSKKNDWLILMPADRLNYDIQYRTNFSEYFKKCFIGIGAQYVFTQTRIPKNFDEIDYPRPPKDYFLLEASVGAQILLRHQPVNISLSASNLLNTNYRDYLDAFRYFMDRPGRNMVLRIHIPFQFKTD